MQAWLKRFCGQIVPSLSNIAVLLICSALIFPSFAQDSPKSAEQLLNDFNEGMDRAIRACMHQYLTAASEPEMSKVSSEAYRLFLLPSFYHPVIYRLMIKADGSSDLIMKRYEITGACTPGKLLRTSTTPVSSPDTAQLIKSLKDSSFWIQNSLPHFGSDGNNWLIEGWRHEKTHLQLWWPFFPHKEFLKKNETLSGESSLPKELRDEALP